MMHGNSNIKWRWWFTFRLAFSLWILLEESCFFSCDNIVKECGVFINRIDEVTENVHYGFCFGRASAFEVPNDDEGTHDQHIMKNTAKNFLQKFQTLMQFRTKNFLLSPLTISHTRWTLCSFLGICGLPLQGSLSTLSRPYWKRLCQSYTWDFLLLYYQTLAATF